jgi:glutaminyl-peptide cyclotransferase
MLRLTRWLSELPALIAVCIIAGCSSRPVPPPFKPPRFDQERAYRRLIELCAMGPRNHGSAGKAQAEQWIQQSLRQSGAEVTVHEFQYTPTGSTQALSFRNIVGRIKPAEARRALIGTHYDTRSVADRDADASKRNQPIIGANDGGSGVAVLLEMAAIWKDYPPPVGIDLIFFDGEDFGRGEDLTDYFLGSKAWVRDRPNYRPEWGAIIDMVGDSSLAIRKERESLARAPAVVDRLWAAAERVKAQSFLDETGGRIFDDHTAFLERGFPVVLLIDFQYRPFHTSADTVDKCSPESLGQVGRTLMEAVEAP